LRLRLRFLQPMLNRKVQDFFLKSQSMHSLYTNMREAL